MLDETYAKSMCYFLRKYEIKNNYFYFQFILYDEIDISYRRNLVLDNGLYSIYYILNKR